ncbi:MAG TPA: MFS transporter [Marinobacter salarius]|nr:MFS transporter [Marinobacter salarius]KXJ45124.1 MAG: MFS transporter [Marinobacter sp. Hex_13]MDC8454043.1 MFS transporter [Marinobacter sp. DS40M6]OLF82566.1 MFS transporter [Marinobacter sp. C18]MBJ7300304.1 MFS transporter [Marinobacter salarius]
MINPVLIAGCIIILVSFAVRASFGLFQLPIALEFAWPRESFSLAIAIQNLFWGIGQPIFGALAERFGDRKAILGGGAFYVTGLVLSAFAITPGQHQLLEMLVGFGIAGTGFGVILAVVGRAAPDKHRSMALGIATAAGSAGQIVGPPVANALLSQMPWQSVFIVFAGFILLSMLALLLMRAPKPQQPTGSEEPMGVVIKRAVKDPSFVLIFIGFFSCGYQLAFITAHFPAFITEMCGPIAPDSLLYTLGVTSASGLGAISIALIGFFNIGGTLFAGWLGNRYSRKYLLAVIYLLRTLVSAAFIMTPITPETVVLFSVSMGSLWLATVPLTSGLVAHIYGLKYMGTLYGLVFFSHQLGGFLGVWLGGALYDIYNNYTLVWWVGVGVGALSAVIHLPVKEYPWAQRRIIATGA